MKKLVVMLLIASFAVVGSVAYANEGPVTTKSDSTMAKKMPRKKLQDVIEKYGYEKLKEVVDKNEIVEIENDDE